MNVTNKQLGILKIIASGNGCRADGNLIPVDLDQLLDRLSGEIHHNQRFHAVQYSNFDKERV